MFVHTSLSQQVAQQKANGNPLPAAVPSDSDDTDAITSTTGESDSGAVYYEGQTEVSGATVSGTSKKRVKHPKLPDKPLDFQVKKYVIIMVASCPKIITSASCMKAVIFTL